MFPEWWQSLGKKEKIKSRKLPASLLCVPRVLLYNRRQLFFSSSPRSYLSQEPRRRRGKKKKPKHNSVHCRFHAVKEKSSPRVPHANKSHPECALITMQTRSLKALLSITMSPVLSADRPEEEGGGAESGGAMEPVETSQTALKDH